MSDQVEPEDARIVPSLPPKGASVTRSPAASEESLPIRSADDGAPTAGDVVALAIESAVAVGGRAVRLGVRATSTAVAAADWLAGGRLGRPATRTLAGALEGPAQGGRHDIEAMRGSAEQQLTRVVAVMVPVVVNHINVETVVERIAINELIARIDVDEMLRQVDINALLEPVDIDGLLARVDVNALMDRVDIWKLVDRAKIGETLAEHTDRMADWNTDLAKRQAAGLENVVDRAVNRVRGRDHGGLAAGPPLLEEQE